MEKNIEKKVNKLIKTTPLRMLGVKHANEYTALSDEIDKMVCVVVPKQENTFYQKVENACVDGLYKQHMTITLEPRMQKFYNEFNYENLMEKYEEKIDEFRKNSEEIIEAHSKKELIHIEKTRIIDMLSRQFAGSEFEKIKLISVANLTRRDIERLYKETKKIIEEKAETVNPEHREEIKNEAIENLKTELTNYWNENELKEEIAEEIIEEKVSVKQKIMNLWEWVKHFFRFKKNIKLLEEKKEDNV